MIRFQQSQAKCLVHGDGSINHDFTDLLLCHSWRLCVFARDWLDLDSHQCLRNGRRAILRIQLIDTQHVAGTPLLNRLEQPPCRALLKRFVEGSPVDQKG